MPANFINLPPNCTGHAQKVSSQKGAMSAALGEPTEIEIGPVNDTITRLDDWVTPFLTVQVISLCKCYQWRGKPQSNHTCFIGSSVSDRDVLQPVRL